jgi:membrane-associated phospholipid phosphatase
MNPFLDWGVPVLLSFQGLGDWLQPIMNAFTMLGDELGYLIIMPVFLWCVDIGLGLRFGIIVLTSSAVNSIFKWTFGLPRPYWVETRVQGLINATSFGFPSGHAQSATVAWGRIAAWVKARWAYIFFGMLILLISISRWYLGVHYPTDTLGGWIIGLLLLGAFLKFEQPVISYLGKQNTLRQAALIFAASLMILTIGFSILAITQSQVIPEAWESAAMANSTESDEAFVPRDPSSIVTAAGALFGVGIGAVFLFQWNQFSPAGPWVQRLSRYLLGLVGMVALYSGLSILFPTGTDLVPLVFRYLRYALVGFWGSYLAPRMFVAVGLAARPNTPQPAG